MVPYYWVSDDLMYMCFIQYVTFSARAHGAPEREEAEPSA